MNKTTFVVGFMLFAMFFGAGNLIFPPKLGFESGADFWAAIIGFTLTGVGLPLLTIIVSANYEGGYQKALNRLSPMISVLLLGAIYLTIGPFFAIPRTGATAYDIAVVPFLSQPSALSLFIFTLIYFCLTLWLSLNKDKIAHRIGALLTPVLLFTIIALIIKSAMMYMSIENAEVSRLSTPLQTGFLEGYNTMDVLAAFAFSVLVINAIKTKSGGKHLVRQTAISAVIAAFGLGFIYIAIGWIGHKIPLSQEAAAEIVANKQNLGTYILNSAATQAFGELGRTLLGVIVTLACLTTCVGLVVATSTYFNSIFSKISYQTYVVIFTLMGFGLANQGLNAVISKSIPVLLILYPIAMTALITLAINLIRPLPLLSQRLAIIFAAVIAIISIAFPEVTANLPFKGLSMEWALFSFAGGVIGCILSKLNH